MHTSACRASRMFSRCNRLRDCGAGHSPAKGDFSFFTVHLIARMICASLLLNCSRLKL